MNVTYQMTPEDAIKFNMYIFSTSPTLRTQNRRNRIIAVSITVVLYFIIFVDMDEALTANIIIALLTALFTFFIYNPIAQRLQKQAIQKLIKNESSKQFFTEKTLTLYPDHIQTISEMGENKMSWKAIKDVKIVPEYAYLFLDTLNAIVIPKRVFPGDDAFDAFIQEGTRFWQDATNTST
jgi:hypothetical protein